MRFIAQAIEAARLFADGLFLFDVDEFLRPQSGCSILPIAQGWLSDQSVGAVALNWAIYGTSGREQAGDGLVIERFTRRSPQEFKVHHIAKSFVRVASCAGPTNHPHAVRLLSGRYINPLGEDVIWDSERFSTGITQHVVWDVARLDHFILKSREEFEAKRARGVGLMNEERDWDSYFTQMDRNEIADPIPPELVAQTKAEIGKILARRPEDIPIPPPAIHSRVAGRPLAEDAYRWQSRHLAAAIDKALAARWLRMDQFKSVLDFGCGCGRALVNYVNLSGPTFYGTDIDEIAIGWCRDHIPGMNFSVNNALPPLQWPDNQFDFIMAVSVFTHLPWKMQIDWLRELKRVLRPGGYLFASTHGDFCANEYLTGESLKTYREGGYCYIRDRNSPVEFPEWYQTTFLSAEYVHRIFGQLFDDVTHVPRGLNNQDTVLLKKA